MVIQIASFASAATSVTDSAEQPWSVEAIIKHHFNSHTSYEFGNPLPPKQVPLSRLEFPLNTLWAGVEVRRRFPRFSVGVEVLTNLSRNAGGAMKDSDWDDNTSPTLLTIYSESKCRMERSFDIRADIDLKLSDWMELPHWFDLRPVIGIRWQQFYLVTHDGTQYERAGAAWTSTDLPGDGIRFDQTYWHYFAGIRMTYDFGKHMREPARMLFSIQLDHAYVDGSNTDRHLLRAGNRITYENTAGNAWHGLLGLKTGLSKNINADLKLDYLWIRTTGTHRLVNDPFRIDFTFNNGVTVWSQQISISLGIEYMF
jgi:hypothetical protein